MKRERLVTRRKKECIKHLVGGTHKRKTCAHVSETERKGERKLISVTKELSTKIMSLTRYYVEQYQKCVLYTSDLITKDDRRPKNSCITQEIINKIEESRKWKEEEGQNSRRLRDELKNATDKAKMKYFVRICYEIMEVRITGHYDLMYMKTKKLG